MNLEEVIELVFGRLGERGVKPDPGVVDEIIEVGAVECLPESRRQDGDGNLEPFDVAGVEMDHDPARATFLDCRILA